MKFTAILASALVAIGSMQPAMANNTPPRCGRLNESCCPDGNSGPKCLEGMCMGGKCKPIPQCGKPGQHCCDPLWFPNGPLCKQGDNDCDLSDNKCRVLRCGAGGQKCCPLGSNAYKQRGHMQCQGDHECVNDWCRKKVPCGAWDQPGCGENKDECHVGLELNARLLCDMPCGGLNKMCCEDGSLQPTKCKQGGHPLTCATNTCVKCGRKNQRVCNPVGDNRPACHQAWTNPDGNHCKACGRRGQKCCDTGRPGGNTKACKGRRNMCKNGTCHACGGRMQHACTNGYVTDWCLPHLMNTNGMCMPMNGGD